MGKRRAGSSRKFANVISLASSRSYANYVAVWYANAATIILANMSVHDITSSVLQRLYNSAVEYFDKEHREQAEEEERECRRPIPLTGNDDPDLMNTCKALEMLYDAANGKISVYPLPPALSLEFAEYVRAYMPAPKTSTLKRGVVGISSELLALAILGAAMTWTYSEHEIGEYGYVFVDVYQPSTVDMDKLNSMARTVVSKVVKGDGSISSIYTGVAAAVALNVGEYLESVEGRTSFSSIRIRRTGNKTMLKALETVDLTLLAKTLRELGIASAVYTLVSSYPSRDEWKRDEAKRALASFIENLSRSIIIYYSQKSRGFSPRAYGVEEIYRVVRSLASENLVEKLEKALGKNWGSVWDELLSVRV